MEVIHDKVLSIQKPVTDDGSYRKDELVLRLMHQLQPLWSHTEAIKALSRASILENPDSTLDHTIIPKQCLMELVTPNEASTINEAFERCRKHKKKEGVIEQQRIASVDKFFKAVPKKASASAQKKAPHWEAPKQPDAPAATRFLESMIPTSISTEEDQYNWRWRILCDSSVWKSVSWMRRGLPHASDLALYHAWKMHTAHTGEEPPFDIEELHREEASGWLRAVAFFWL